MYSLGFDWEAVDFFSFIADVASGDEDLQIMYGVGGERELAEYELDHLPRLRELAAGPRRQRRVRAAAARRLGCAARFGVPAHEERTTTWTAASGRFSASRSTRRSSTGENPTPASGRCAASHSTSRRRRSCAGSPSIGARSLAALIGQDARRRSGRWPPTRSTPTSSPTASTSAVCSPSTTDRRPSTPRSLLAPLVRFLPPDDPDPRHGPRHRRRADRGRLRAALPGRRDRRRLHRQGGQRSRSARSGWCRRCRRSASTSGPASCARSCCRSPDRSSSTPRRSIRTADSSWATSRRRSPTWR